MKNKFVALLLALLMGVVSIPMTAFAADDFMWHIKAITEADAAEVTKLTEPVRNCHESFKSLVDALMRVKAQGSITKSEIKAIHNFYENLSQGQIPTTDKGLLDALHSNNLVTDVQYEMTLKLLQ